MEKPIKHLLVIRLSAMGDVAMTVPVLVALLKTYPTLKITILTKAFFKPFFAQFPNVTIKVFETTGVYKGITGLKKLSNELQDLKINGVADLHNVLRSNIIKLFYSFSKVPFQQINKGRAQKRELTRLENKVFKPLKTTHERYADVFRALGFSFTLTGEEKLVRENLDDELVQFMGKSLQKWIGIAPFAHRESKEYPIEKIIQVIKELDKTENYKIVLFGGGKQEIATLTSISKKYKNTILAAGQLKLNQELALISNLDVMLSMDSGNGHIAAMYGIPVITIWGVTHPFAGFAPYGQPEGNSIFPDLVKYNKIPTSIYGNKVPKGYEEVMQTITPKEIVNKIIEVTR